MRVGADWKSRLLYHIPNMKLQLIHGLKRGKRKMSVLTTPLDTRSEMVADASLVGYSIRVES